MTIYVLELFVCLLSIIVRVSPVLMSRDLKCTRCWGKFKMIGFLITSLFNWVLHAINTFNILFITDSVVCIELL